MVNQNILILRPKFNIFWAIFIRLFLTFNTSVHKHKLQEISNPGRYEFLEIALDVNNK
jgi:hypothetical protein